MNTVSAPRADDHDRGTPHATPGPVVKEPSTVRPNTGVHANSIAASMSPEARRLSTNRPAARKRIGEIMKARASGETFIAIGKRYGITGTRVRQIFCREIARVESTSGD